MKNMPAAGRPAKVPGNQTPQRPHGALSGSVRQRAGVDKPWDPTGKATPMPKDTEGNDTGA